MNLHGRNIVYMGTPEFAVPGLQALVEAGHRIVGVITAPDKPAGRGMKLTESAVKKYASANHLKVLQPEKLKDPLFIEELRSLKADLQVVVAFRMLPEIVWNMPPLGTINLHGSLLPQYRGAAPINWAVINGEKETGLTTFKLKQEIDTGDVLLQEIVSIGDTETAGELHDRMKMVGAELILKTVNGMLDGNLELVAQETILDNGSLTADHGIVLKPAPKIFTATCQIDWNKNAQTIFNLIRGLSPSPAAFTDLGDKILKIYRAEIEMILPSSKKGRWESDKKSFLKFACADGYISLKEVQLEGKKKMSIEEFLNGYRF